MTGHGRLSSCTGPSGRSPGTSSVLSRGGCLGLWEAELLAVNGNINNSSSNNNSNSDGNNNNNNNSDNNNNNNNNVVNN